MTLAERLAHRLREEIERLRGVLDLPSPLSSAVTPPPAGSSLEPWIVHAWILRDGSVRCVGAGVNGDKAETPRPATCSEVLDALERGAEFIAREEARVIEMCAEIFLPATTTEERSATLLRAASSWPWTRTFGATRSGTVPPESQLAPLLWCARDLALLRAGIEAGPARNRLLEPWAAGIDPADVIDWVAEGIERTKPGGGARYHAWCSGSLEVELSNDQVERERMLAERFFGVPFTERRRVRSAELLGGLAGRPDALALKSGRPAMYGLIVDETPTCYSNEFERLRAGLASGDMLVRGEQLACLYASLPETVRFARTTPRLIARVASGAAQQHLLKVIAPRALELESAAGALEDAGESAGRLAEALRLHIERFQCPLLHEPPPRSAVDADQLATALDAAFASFVERIGTHSAKVAGIIRRKSEARAPAERWKLWQREQTQCERFLLLLARALWIDQVQPDLRRRARNHQALAMPIHEEVTKMYSRAGTPNRDSRQLVFEDGTAISFDSPLLDAETIQLVYRGMDLLGSVDSHRLLHWEVRSGYTQWINGAALPNVLDLERGYGELAERLEIRHKGAPQRLRAILTAQKTCNFPIPGETRSTSNLIILREWEGSGRRPGRIRIELSSILMPTFVHALQGRGPSSMKRLVPLVGLPPFVGNERSHGAQATLAMLVTREMRVRAVELYEHGGVNIDLPRWAQLAEQARIPRSHVSQQLKPILSRWTRDSEDQPAFLRVDGKTRFTLGDRYEAARRFLIEAGKRESVGALAGQRSAQKRRAKLERLGRSCSQ